MDETTEDNMIIGYPGVYAKNDTQKGDVFFMPGKKGNALCTDGNSHNFNFVGIENSCFSTPSKCAVNGMTIAMWVMIPPLPGNFVDGPKYCFDGIPLGFSVKLDYKVSTGAKLRVAFERNAENAFMWKTTYNDNEWMHIAVSYSLTSGYKLYFNGEQVNGVYEGNANDATQTVIGFGGWAKDGKSMPCCVDEVYTWPEIKTASFIMSFVNEYNN